MSHLNRAASCRRPRASRVKYEANAKPHVLCFIDGSNLFASIQREMDPTTGAIVRNHSVRVNAPQLVYGLLANDRPFAKKVIVGPQSPKYSGLWKHWRDLKYEVMGVSPDVDDILHAQALLALSQSYRHPCVLQLVTGDGNRNGGRSSFCDVVRAAVRKGVPTEIYAFRHSLSSHLRALAMRHPTLVTVVELDAYREGISFREGAARHHPGAQAPVQEEAAAAAAQPARATSTAAALVALVQAGTITAESLAAAVDAVGGGGAIPSPTSPSSAAAADNADTLSVSSGEWEQVQLDAALAASLQDDLLCPITHEVMMEPVVTADGHSYERTAIEQWLRHSTLSPLTGERLAHTSLVPNMALRSQIRSMLQAHDNSGAGTSTAHAAAAAANEEVDECD